MSQWLVDLLILLGVLAIVVIAAWYVLQQMTLPEPIQRILIIVLVILAAIIGVAILLSMRGGVKLGEAIPQRSGGLLSNAPFPSTRVLAPVLYENVAASLDAGDPAGGRHPCPGGKVIA